MGHIRTITKARTRRDKEYISFIRQLPCIVCLSLDETATGPSEAHHQNPKGHGGKGIKTDDSRCMPLCNYHHRQRHDIGSDTFSKKYDLNYEWVINNLRRIKEELDACSRT
jgi:hypothetical protein